MRAHLDRHADRTRSTCLEVPRLSQRTPAGGAAAGAACSRIRSLDAAYAEAGIGPEDLSLAEVYDLSTALELDWIEHLGLCTEAAKPSGLLRGGATTIGGRVPVNPSGGLACFGEARARPGHRPGAAS